MSQGSQEEWQRVFAIGAAIYIFGWLFFMIFASSDVQPWAVLEDNETKITNKKEKMWKNGSQIVGKSYIQSNDGFIDDDGQEVRNTSDIEKLSINTNNIDNLEINTDKIGNLSINTENIGTLAITQ